MFMRLWEKLPPLRARKREREEMAKRLSVMVEEEGFLVLDVDIMAKFGLNRRLALRAACDLALEEKAQLRCNASGQLELVSNREFDRMVLGALFGTDAVGAGVPADAEGPRPEMAVDLSEAAVADAAPPAATGNIIFFPEDALYDDTGMEIAGEQLPGDTIPMDATENLAWFDLEVAPPEDESAATGEKVPFDRQNLPERKREPWLALENAVLDE